MFSRVLRMLLPRLYARRRAARLARELEERRAEFRAWAPLPVLKRERPDGGRGPARGAVHELTPDETSRLRG